jgi:hypothetical protein
MQCRYHMKDRTREGRKEGRDWKLGGKNLMSRVQKLDNSSSARSRDVHACLVRSRSQLQFSGRRRACGRSSSVHHTNQKLATRVDQGHRTGGLKQWSTFAGYSQP